MYQGVFQDVDGENWTLKIEDGYYTVNALKFGGSPFSTQMDNGDSTIYKPVKCQSATIGLVAVGDNYQFGLYTGNAQGHKVTLLDSDNNVEWVGYITPSLYNIGYARYLEELSVDCIDGLSTLQYYKYTPIGYNPDVQTLLDIVVHCIKKCSCYKYLVAMAGTQIDHNGSYFGSLWENCEISESNFIDPKANEDDNDETSTYLEVLESICQYACVTAVAKGDTVYLIDYDSLMLSSCPAIRVTLSNSSKSSTTITPDDFTIIGTSYASADTTLSLDNVYNKVTVGTEPKEYDTLLVDFFEDVENITAADTYYETSDTYGVYYTEYVTNAYTGDSMQLLVDYVYQWQGNPYQFNLLALKYYKSPYYQCHHYYLSGAHAVETSSFQNSVKYHNTQSYAGGWIVRCFVQKIEKWDQLVSMIDRGQMLGDYTIDDVFALCDVSNIDFDEYIFLTNPQSNHISNQLSDTYDLPFVTTNIELTRTVLFGGENTYLLIEGEVLFHRNVQNEGDPMYPVPSGEVDIDHGAEMMDADQAYIKCKLTWGGYHWNGTNWSRSTPQTFKVPFLKENERFDKMMYKSNPIINSVTWRIGTDKKGYLIPMPDSPELLSGAPSLSIYAPRDADIAGAGYAFVTDFMALKNFKVTPIVGDPTFSGALDEDTVYTNVIDADNAMELDEINLKVMTQDGKAPSTSVVSYYRYGSRYWLGDTYNDATESGETGIIRYDGSYCTGSLRQEEHLVYRISNQYSSPAKMLELTLRNDIKPYDRVTETNLNTTMIVESVGVDYRNKQYNYKLIEKK